MEFEPIKYSHLKDCSDLLVTVFNVSPWNETWSFETALKRLEDSYATPGFYGIIAVDGSKALGFALGYSETWYAGKNFYLKEMCVQSDKQRSGIGTEILDVLCRDLDKKGVDMIYLLTMRDSPAAAFYEKYEFSYSTSMSMMLKDMTP